MLLASGYGARVAHVVATAVLVAIMLLVAVASARAQRAVTPASAAAGGRPNPAAPASRSTEAFTATLQIQGRLAVDNPASAQAAIDGERAYLPLKDGHLVAIDLEHLIVAWKIEVPTALAPAAGDGLVFVAGDEVLTAVQADGHVRWSLPMRGGFSAPPLWAGGWLIAPTPSGDVLALRAADGALLWTKPLGSPARARPAVEGDRLYLGLDDGRVVSLNLRDGSPRWDYMLGGTPGPILALPDRVFVGSRDKFFYCLNPENGKQQWKWRTGGTIGTQPVADDKRVYFTSLDNVLRALDRNNGTQKWKQGLPLRPITGPLHVGDLLYVAGVAAELRGYRADETGAPAGQFQAQYDLATPPQLVPSGIPELAGILLLTRTGEVLVLRVTLDPALLPIAYPLGTEVPLIPPAGFVEPASPPEAP